MNDSLVANFIILVNNFSYFSDISFLFIRISANLIKVKNSSFFDGNILSNFKNSSNKWFNLSSFNKNLKQKILCEFTNLSHKNKVSEKSVIKSLNNKSNIIWKSSWNWVFVGLTINIFKYILNNSNLTLLVKSFEGKT